MRQFQEVGLELDALCFLDLLLGQSWTPVEPLRAFGSQLQEIFLLYAAVYSVLCI